MPKRKNPAAPVAPPRPAPVRPAPPPQRPSPERPTPFTPTKPSTMPRPKLSFWEDIPADHAFYGHPVLHEFGLMLSDDALSEIGRRVDVDRCVENSFDAYLAIAKAESGREPELTDLARQLVESVWDIPPDQMKGGIDSVSDDVADLDFGEPSESRTLWDLDLSTVSQVQKRLLLNTIIQGCAIHAMLNYPHMVQSDLNRISKGLLGLYEKFTWNALAMYWRMDYASMSDFAMRSQAAGYERVKYEQREGEEVPVVYAKGINFAVTLQEFVKGVAEIICMETLARLDPDTQNVVVEMADQVRYEPYQIMVGPQVWRRLLRAVHPNEPVASFLLRVSLMEPDEMMRFVVQALRVGEE